MSERQLLQRAQCHDRTAIEDLFRREWRPVYDLIYRTVQNRSEAQDLTQEVFLRAFRSLDRHQETGKPFRQYLTTIALNLLRDRWRTRKPPNTRLDSIGTLVADDRSPEEHLLLNADAAVVRAALAELSDDHQQVIQLRVIEGRSSQEAGDIMGRHPDAIRQLQRRALTALRTTLREELPL